MIKKSQGPNPPKPTVITGGPKNWTSSLAAATGPRGPSIKKLVNDPSKDLDLLITAHFAYGQGVYTVEVPGVAKKMTRPSLAEALHDLANEIIRCNLYGSGKFDPKAAHHVGRVKKCEYCSGRIFFVKTVNGRWMPLDQQTIANSMVGNIRGYEVAEDGRELQARTVSARHVGEVWIAHQNVCGSTREPPESPMLREWWEKNRGVTLAAAEEATHSLARMKRELGRKAA